MRPRDYLWVAMKLIGVILVLGGLIALFDWILTLVEYVFRALFGSSSSSRSIQFDPPRPPLWFYAPVFSNLLRSLAVLFLGGALIKYTDMCLDVITIRTHPPMNPPPATDQEPSPAQ